MVLSRGELPFLKMLMFDVWRGKYFLKEGLKVWRGDAKAVAELFQGFVSGFKGASIRASLEPLNACFNTKQS